MTGPRAERRPEMAKRRARGRARSARRGANAAGTIDRSRVSNGLMDANVIPRVLMGSVDGLEIVVVGTLEFARNVLMSTVSGAANVGAEVFTATTAGARRVVLAAAQMIGDVASTAQGTLRATIADARRPRRAAARPGPRRPAESTAQAAEVSLSSPKTSRSRRRVRQPRPATGASSRTSEAA